MKHCPGCNTKKQDSDFHKKAASKDGFNGKCKPCVKSHNSRYYASNHGKIRNYELKKKYKLETGEYEKMFERQGGACAICKLVEKWTSSGETKQLAVDHNKNTGKVRGLLCHACNTGLGLFFHNPNTLDDAASYMRLTDG